MEGIVETSSGMMEDMATKPNEQGLFADEIHPSKMEDMATKPNEQGLSSDKIHLSNTKATSPRYDAQYLSILVDTTESVSSFFLRHDRN